HRVDAGADDRDGDQPETLMAPVRRDEPGQQQRQCVGHAGESPRLRDRQPSAGQRTFRLVHPIDVEVVDLIQRVVAGVEERRHRRSHERRGEKRRPPRFTRGGTNRRQRARHESERGGNQREGPREIQIGPGGPRFPAPGSRSRFSGEPRSLNPEPRTPVDPHAMASVTAAAIAVLMKFSTSLFRIPGPSSVAPSALSTMVPAVAPATTAGVMDAGISPIATPAVASANAAASPAVVPSSDIAPGVPGLTRLKVVTRYGDRPQALPISLATVSLPPAVSEATIASRADDVYGVAMAAMAATAATPQFAIALPAPRRPARSSAIPSRTLRCSPNREETEAARNVRNSSTHARPPPPA